MKGPFGTTSVEKMIINAEENKKPQKILSPKEMRSDEIALISLDRCAANSVRIENTINAMILYSVLRNRNEAPGTFVSSVSESSSLQLKIGTSNSFIIGPIVYSFHRKHHTRSQFSYVTSTS
ncbi:hypothetical protein RF11_00039 [Thelohanellus kitauei]|uniref:Uncharacterized protein n=1 Tax=Thelohanellus kitauei TaxID=669202 RepID=A0A0C2NCP3_THEKT|nr:hypothetical protein RF11_00039 [Thelohanellus kitauei]